MLSLPALPERKRNTGIHPFLPERPGCRYYLSTRRLSIAARASGSKCALVLGIDA
jgi:hypothetical protein